jgi:hypothetical protein
MQNVIIKKAVILLGSSSNSLESSIKTSKAEVLCEEFAPSVIEETLLSVKWSFALKRIDNLDGESGVFKEIPGVNDCLKVAVIAPSNLEWYIEREKIYFKGSKLSSIFYYPKRILTGLLNNDSSITHIVPESFRLLAALSLASQVSFALYADSIFTDGLKKQYLIKLDEVKRIYSADCNIINSATL